MRLKSLLFLLLIIVSSQAFAQVPVIDSMLVDERQDQLIVIGKLGAQQGRVFVDDTELFVKVWSPYYLRCELPRSGRGSCGPVVVRNTTGISRERLLSAFYLNISYQNTGGEGGNLHHEYGLDFMRWDLYWRGDLLRASARKYGELSRISKGSANGEASLTDYDTHTTGSGRSSGYVAWADTSDSTYQLKGYLRWNSKTGSFLLQTKDVGPFTGWTTFATLPDHGIPYDYETTPVSYYEPSLEIGVHLDSVLHVDTLIYGPHSSPFSQFFYTPPKISCRVESSFAQFIPQFSNRLWIDPSEITSNQFRIGPNPCSDFLQMFYKTEAEYLVVDSFGKRRIVSMEQSRISTKHLPNGAYLLVNSRSGAAARFFVLH